MKTVKVVLSPEAEEVYTYLNKEKSESEAVGKRSPEAQILDAFTKKVEIIKSNFHYGLPIAKAKIPEVYIEKYGVTNLYWVELPHFWRFLYSLGEGDTNIEIVAFVLDIFDHKAYDKRMGYKSQ